MGTESTTSLDPVTTGGADRIGLFAAIGAGLMTVFLAAILLIQVEVTDTEVAATRTCGSVFDSMVDRSGWEQWWVADLDEPDDVRSALVRTSRCPDAINQRVVIAAVFGTTAAVAGAIAITRRHAGRSAHADASPIGRRVARIGRVTTVLGGALTALGVITIIVLVADGDSTLFLYTDRTVVAAVGLILLIPTITLVVLGRTLVLLVEYLDRPEQGSAR